MITVYYLPCADKFCLSIDCKYIDYHGDSHETASECWFSRITFGKLLKKQGIEKVPDYGFKIAGGFLRTDDMLIKPKKSKRTR